MAIRSKRKRLSLLKKQRLPVDKRQPAPKGYHYMPDGTLMSDFEHERIEREKLYGEDIKTPVNNVVPRPKGVAIKAAETSIEPQATSVFPSDMGYTEKTYAPPITAHIEKTQVEEDSFYINGIDIDLSNLNTNGEVRNFSISGQNGAMFSLQVYEEVDGKYYNFGKQEWSTSPTMLKNKLIEGNVYEGKINFSTVATKILKYVIRLHAVSIGDVKTKHVNYVERFLVDGSLDENRSIGSRSTILTRRIYTQAEKTLRLSCIAPSRSDAVTDTKDGAISSGTSLVMDTSFLTKGILAGDVVTGTNISATITAVDVGGVADTYTISTAPTGAVGDGATLTFTGPFKDMTPDYDTTTGSDSIIMSSGEEATRSFSISLTAATGKAFTIIRQPVPSDLCAVRLITFDTAASAIPGEDTSSSSLFYRWPVTSTNGGVWGLKEGMVLDSSSTGSQGGTNTTFNSFIKNYTTTVSTIGAISTRAAVDVFVPGVKLTGNPTISTSVAGNRIVHQAGELVFNKQQADALKSDANVKILGYGRKQIKSMTWGTDVVLSDLKVELTEVSTTTSSAVSNSTTIPVAEQKGITIDISSMTGVNVASTAVFPKVTAKAAASGAGNLTVSAAQTLDDGQTLVFTNAGSKAKITGTIKILDSGPDDVVLYFDVEKFLSCA
jgi:hypothetical protein